jgi:hypothetical protein
MELTRISCSRHIDVIVNVLIANQLILKRYFSESYLSQHLSILSTQFRAHEDCLGPLEQMLKLAQ